MGRREIEKVMEKRIRLVLKVLGRLKICSSESVLLIFITKLLIATPKLIFIIPDRTYRHLSWPNLSVILPDQAYRYCF